MKKNLKKVISAVLALALAMSSFVVMTTSAATFADVADTASYAEAVNALAALGAIAGTGDGTFKPDDNITRAEAATMVVAALNLSADAQNAGATSKFADVNEQAKWAVGYVNVGVAQNYISGTSATTFNPLDNVTYAQMLTMLTRILGYGDFAVSRGGYPDGYVTSAAIAGIVKGVAAGNEEPITRAQAAQLIWNAVQAPMLDITTFTGSIDDTQLKKMDGSTDSGRKFKTVLSDKFNAYVLNVEITATSKSSNLENGTVSMQIIGANEWDPEFKTTSSKGNFKQEVAVGKTDAENYQFASAKVVAEFNDDEEWTLIYFAPTGKVTTKTIDGTLVNGQTGSYDGVDITATTHNGPDNQPGTSDDYTTYAGTLRIKKSETSSPSTATEYKLEGATLYVNGAPFCAVTDTTEAAVQAMLAKSTGDVTLVQDSDLAGRVYDKILMDYYVVASVNQVKVNTNNTELRLTGVVAMPSAANGIAVAPGSTLKVDTDLVADGDATITVTKAGAAADLTALANGDVVALKYDITKAIDTFGYNYKHMEILATTDVASGKFSSYDNEKDVYYVGGVEYEAAKNLAPPVLTLGSTYTFKLDPFGRLFEADEETTTINYAIVEKFIDLDQNPGISAEYDYLDVVTLDGQSKRLYVDTNAKANVRTVMTAAGIGAVASTNATNHDFDERVIQYKVKTSTGRVMDVAFTKTANANNIYDFTANAEEYNPASNRLGRPLADSVVVLDASKYDPANPSASDYKASSVSALAGNIDYQGVLVHKNSANQWAYVIIKSAGAMYSTTSDFAVVVADASANNMAVTEDGEDVYQLSVMMNGASAADKLNISQTAEVYINNHPQQPTMSNGQGGTVNDYSYASNVAFIEQGAAFFYTTDSEGLVDRIDVIFMGGYNYADIVNGSYNYNVKGLPGDNVVAKANSWYNQVDDSQIQTSNEMVQLFVAPVVTANNNSISFGAMGGTTYVPAQGQTPASGGRYVNTTVDYGFSVASDANIYEFDLSDKDTNAYAFDAGSFMGLDLGSVEAANGYAYVTGADVAQAKTDFNGLVQYAFVMAVDGVITNALVLVD